MSLIATLAHLDHTCCNQPQMFVDGHKILYQLK